MKHVIDRGSGPAVLLIPGIQGRSEWLLPTVEALQRRHRVLTVSLQQLGPAEPGFGPWIEHLAALATTAGQPLTVVGMSFGGLLALRLAAWHAGLVQSLVVVSAPPPGWRLDPVSARYARHPVLSLPLFACRGALRLAPEMLAARDSWLGRIALSAGHGVRILRYPASTVQMASWAKAWMATDFSGDCRQVRARALVVTGEDDLERVVPTRDTIRYLACLRGATHVRIPATGHLGLITRPDVFSDLLENFLAAAEPGSRMRE